VRLTLVAPEDLDQIAHHRKIPRELRPQVVARLLREATAQGGVLSLSDLGVLLGVTYPTAAAAVHQYERRHHVILPYRGVLHDLGPTTTHKVQAIELKLQGLLTRQIAQRIHHDPRSVDIYQNDFERVYELHAEGKSPRQISFLIKRSIALVRQYIRLIEEYLEAVGPDHAPNPQTQTKRPPQARKAKGQSP
jgi:ribosomal protein L25 (general stress protein Ctc)